MKTLVVMLGLLFFGFPAVSAQSDTTNKVYPRYPTVMYVMRVPAESSWVQMYHEVEKCSGRWGDVESVKWYITDHPVEGDLGTWEHPKPSGVSFGIWRVLEDGSRQIVIMRNDTTTIRHEILHDVLWVNGRRGTALDHPEPPFGLCAAREANE